MNPQTCLCMLGIRKRCFCCAGAYDTMPPIIKASQGSLYLAPPFHLAGIIKLKAAPI
jgi:hypothetical protein